MDGETDGSGYEPLASDLADVAEMFGTEGLHEALVPLERGADARDEIGRGVVAGAFSPHRRELIGVELPAFEVSAKTIRASGEVFGMEARRGHVVRRGPELSGAQRGDGAREIFLYLFACAEQVGDNGIVTGKNAA
jgi:hypothetical protein